MQSLTLKSQNYFQNRNNRKPTHSFAPRRFKIQRYLRKLELPKTDMAKLTNFLKPKKSKL